MLGIAWVETTRDGTKIGFLFRFVYPFSYHSWEGAQPMIGGGGSSGTPRYKVTSLQVTPHVIVSKHHAISHRATVPKNYPKRLKLIK